MKAKALLMTALATMAIATTASATVPSGYDPWVNVEKVKGDWHKSAYSQEVNVPKVTALEARTDGYCHDIIKSFAGDIIAMPNQDGPSISQKQYDEMMRGN